MNFTRIFQIKRIITSFALIHAEQMLWLKMNGARIVYGYAAAASAAAAVAVTSVNQRISQGRL